MQTRQLRTSFRMALRCLWLISAVGVMSLAAAQPTVLPDAAATAEVFVQTGNPMLVTMVRFSPSGDRVATCDGVGAVMGWDAPSGRQFRELFKHTGMCLGLSFTPDSQMVVSSGGARSGNEVVMSRWLDGSTVQSWSGYKGQVLDVAATNDGRGAWALGDQAVLLRWALGSAAPVRSLPLSLPGELADKAPYNATMVLTREQDKAYVARRDGTVLLVDLAGSSPPALLAKVSESVFALALSPDGTQLAVAMGSMMGSSTKDVVVLDTTTGREVRRFIGHEGNVSALAFSPDGRFLASAAQIDTQIMLNGSIKSIGQHEALRVWRMQDGSLLSEARNDRNRNGVPFLRGSLHFSPVPASGSPTELRLALALWDEAARIYDLDAAGKLKLAHTLEGRGLSPRQLRASDALGRLLVTDGRPRVSPKEVYFQAATLRSEFGQSSDWTPERVQRTDLIYGPRGMLTQVNRAAMWDLKTGRLDRVIDWQRGPPSDVGVDSQGRFTSVAPLFPGTIVFQPLRTYLLRQASADAQGQVQLDHFAYEPWDGPLDTLFVATAPAAASGTSAMPAIPVPLLAGVPAGLAAGSYRTDVIVQSPGQRFTAVGGIPIDGAKIGSAPALQPRLLVQERLASGARVARHDIALPGLVRAMAFSADEATLWISGTTSGLPYDMEHVAWLMAVDLASGRIVRQWPLAQNITVDTIVAHPGGQMAITNGGTNLSVWDIRQQERKYFVRASESLRAVRALALTADGKTIAATDTTGWTVVWDWPLDAEPVRRWARAMPTPSTHVLTFLAGDQRMAAGSDDGSVRLLSSMDGSEIARMIRFDTGEWITIIPEGYFVASQDGDRWVNVRMGDKVYGIDQFYDVFYRPDIVERRLAGQSIRSMAPVTLDDALRQPPPQVALGLPVTGALKPGQKITLALEAKTLGGGVGEVRLLHNGKLVEVFNSAAPRVQPAHGPSSPAPVAVSLAVKAKDTAQTEKVMTRALEIATETQQDPANAPTVLPLLNAQAEVELVPGDNVFTVIAFNGVGNLNARPLTRALSVDGPPVKPRIFVLAVGIDKFQHPYAPSLNNGVKDSTDVAGAFKARLSQAYAGAEVIVRLVQGPQATRTGLDAALAQLKKEVRSSDILVWFVASHGTLDNNSLYGIVLQDWDGKETEQSLFSTRAILEASRQIKAFTQFVILDTCHAGGASSLVQGLYDARLSVLARNMGLHVFASASETQEALDGGAGPNGNGLFTSTLLQGLNSRKADKNGDGRVTISELGDYARQQTIELALKKKIRQEPLMMNFGKDVTVYELQ